MTERDRREGTGGTEDNVRDELDDATQRGRKKDVTPDSVEDEGTGGVKDNVEDDLRKTQRD